jgi:site-specific DNA-cytosine methylase
VTYTAVDCQGFAGGFTLGVVQAGFKLVGKREKKGGFGARNCEVNRHLLGDDWQTEACDPSEWSVPQGGASLVFGNPPCSGFSVLSTKSFRGTDSKINQCMWDFVEYAARVRPAVAIFESVQLAFTQGKTLMRDLRQRLEDLTGEQWALHHVLHNALSVGGPAMRRRYFWVASRVPFGVELPQLDRIPLLRDVIGDLQTLDQSWESQRYWLDSTWYTHRFRDRYADGSDWVDGHISIDNPHTRRTRELLNSVEWRPNEHAQVVTRRYFDEHGDLPPGWKHLVDKLKGQDFFQGFNTPTMWNPDHHARVITGAGLLNGVHWAEGRTFTHREAARILGYPDSWLIEPLRSVPSLFLTWGKGITVDCGRWIAEWARNSLDGTPGSLTGELIGDREYLLDVTNAWKTGCATVSIRVKDNWREDKVTEVALAQETQRGRPRPGETVERDRRVFETLAGAGKTREALATELDMEPKLVYLSLYRLRRDGRVERVRQDGAHFWQRVAGAE